MRHELVSIPEAAGFSSAVAGRSLRHLINALGRREFEHELARSISEIFKSNSVYISQGPWDGSGQILALSFDDTESAKGHCDFYMSHKLWRHDPAKADGAHWDGLKPKLFHTSALGPETREMQHFYRTQQIADRVAVCGTRAGRRLGLCIARSEAQGIFSVEEQDQLSLLRDVAYPLLVRHYDLLNEDRDLATAFTSLSLIERCLALAPIGIPRREAQVIARMLNGVSAEGTSSELGIAKETVISYRKRFYDRIGISSFRELLVWYVGIFGQSRHRLLGCELVEGMV